MEKVHKKCLKNIVAVMAQNHGRAPLFTGDAVQVAARVGDVGVVHALVEIAIRDASTSAIVACALTGNTGSLRVLEKLGLTRVGEVVFPDFSQPAVKMHRKCEHKSG